MDGWFLAPSPTLAGILIHTTVTQHPVLGQEGEAIAWLEPSHVLHVSTSDSTGWAHRVRFLGQVSSPPTGFLPTFFWVLFWAQGSKDHSNGHRPLFNLCF